MSMRQNYPLRHVWLALGLVVSLVACTSESKHNQQPKPEKQSANMPRVTESEPSKSKSLTDLSKEKSDDLAQECEPEFRTKDGNCEVPNNTSVPSEKKQEQQGDKTPVKKKETDEDEPG